MARAPEGPAGREGTSILPSAALGLLTVVLLASVLRGLAGPNILPEYLASRYVALILTVHGLLAMVMGFTGGGRKEPASVWVSGGVGLLVGGVASLVYAHRGLVPGGVFCPAALASGSLVLAVTGAVIARQFEQRPLAPALAYCGLLLAILAGAFVKTGVVSGTITLPVNMITLGMMTGQKDEPVPDVPVVLASPDGKRRLYETRTNAAGNYVFNGPSPGSYSLFVQDTEPVRGKGGWVQSTVKAGSVLSGQGLGMGDVSLPSYSADQGSPFLDAPSGGTDDPDGGTLDVPGVPGQY